MKTKFYKIVFVLLTALFSTSAFAQMSVDPNHDFYKDAQKWEIQGVISNLPPVRPYPVNVIKEILNTVIEKGSSSQSEKAQAYWEELTGKGWHIQLDANVNYKNSSGDSYFGVDGEPEVNGDIVFFDDLVGIGYRLGFAGYNKTAKEYISTFYPWASNFYRDTLQDPGEIGPLYIYLDTDDLISIGNTSYYVQAGLSRLGFGRFLGNGLTLSEGAYHSANIIFTLRKERWNYTQLYSAIGASKSYDGTMLLPNKYLTFHQFEFNITPRISLSYYENVVFGKRFDFSYFLPAPYMALQGIGGCEDNLQMGLLFNYRIIDGLLWSTDLFVDDVNFNDLVKFNFDTKLRIAARTGLIYYPEDFIISKVALDYTFVTPYTYSHWDYSDDTEKTITENTYNYQNYTNNGLPIGTSLPPNSDQVKLSFDISPVKNLDLTFNFAFARHGNSAETLPVNEAMRYILADEGVYATDGSIYEHVMLSKEDGKWSYLPSAWNSLNFLNQEHMMYIFQGGVEAKYVLGRFNWGSVSVMAGYTAEYIRNKGVDSNLFTGGLTTPVDSDEDGEIEYYTYNGVDYTSEEELVAAYKADWVSTFTNQFNNYFYIGLRYKW